MLRVPRQLSRVFALLAVSVACPGAVLVIGGESMFATAGWLWVGLAVVAAAALTRYLPTASSELADWAADHDRLLLLEAAVTASGDGVMVAEAAPPGALGPRVVFANPAFEQIMGYSAEEVVGLSPSVFCVPGSGGGSPTLFDPGAGAEVSALEAIRAALRGTAPAWLDLPARRKDGGSIWTEWQVVPVTDHAGRVAHWVAVVRDTSERRRLEDQLRQSQKMEAVGRLAGGIAHDFNNLLTVILGNAMVLKQGLADGNTDELVDDIAGAADRAAGLVRQLLTFSRRQPARPEVVDLNAVVTNMGGMLRRLLGEKVTVATKLAAGPVPTRIDRGQLEQVVVNLAVNARDAMPGGGTLTISTAAVPGPDGGSRFARLQVTDTGTGMTADVKAKVFEPFFTTKGPDKGTGLGLATVYGIVQQAGGRVGLDSTPGAGTTFRIDLPWSATAAVPQSGILPTPPGGPGIGRGRTVLLVEDEESVRKFARMALEGQGYTVTEATDGESALRVLQPDRPPDLLVTDLAMPGVGGRELAARVRADHPGTGVVFVSGYAPDADRLGGVPGAVFLPKPFTPVDLVRAARRALSRVAVGAA